MKLRKEIGEQKVDSLYNLLGYKESKFTIPEQREWLEMLIDEYKTYL